MTVYMSSQAGATAQFFTDDGTPNAGGKIYTYAAGGTTPTATYTSSTGLTQNSNPITLDAAGRPPAEIWLAEGTNYKFVITNSTGSETRTYDNIPAAGDVSSILALLAASNGSSLIGFLQSGSNTVARTVQSKLQDSLCVFDFMTSAQITAVKTRTYGGVTAAAITTAVQNALTAAAGRFVYFPAGLYKISSTLSAPTSAAVDVWSPGLRIVGDGLLTQFDDQVASAPMIDIDSSTHGGTYTACWGAEVSNILITADTSPASSVGIRVLNGYEVKIDHVYIRQVKTGIELKNGLYADDGWNNVSITQCWLDNCATWGVKADGSAGRNEGSYTYMRQVLFQTCGTASASTPPPSGGMIWKGQIFTMEECAFANGCQNVGLYIKGESGLGQTVDLRNTTFENCVKRGLYVTGITAFKGRNLQFYNNDDFIATNQCEFDGSSYVIRAVDIDGVVVRATSGNSSCTAFKISGASVDFDTCRVRPQTVVFENFDYAGQTRFSGWQFDTIPNNCFMNVASATEVTLKPNQFIPNGNTVPLRKRGPNNQSGVGVASTSGEWLPHQVAAAGLALSTTGMVAATKYNVYIYDNDGTAALQFSTTAWTIDSSTGYPVKTGDATMYYVGSVLSHPTDADKAATSASGWVNPSIVAGSQTGVFSYLWADSSNRLRIKYSAMPSSDTDGTVVGSQV